MKKAAVLAVLIHLLAFPAGPRAEEESLGALEQGIASILAENEAIISGSGLQAVGAFPAAVRVRSPEELLLMGMPLTARREFLALPAAARAGSSLLPNLVRRLAESGYPGDALSLFGEVQPHLSEPQRSEALFEVGRIRWERREYDAAAEALRQISGTSGSASEARILLARYLASRGDAPSASKHLSGVLPSGRRSLIAGEIEMIRQDPAGAALAWGGAAPGSPGEFSARIRFLRDAEGHAGASRELRAIADRKSGSFPERGASMEALGIVLLKTGDHNASLAVAREGLSDAGRWRMAAMRRSAWDGSRSGAENLWKELAALFPYEEDIGAFRSAGGRFRAAALLLDTAGKAEVSSADIARSIAPALDAVSGRRMVILDKIRRSEEIRGAFLAAEQRARGIAGRLGNSATPAAHVEWGAHEDPEIAALLGALDKAIGETGGRLERLKREHRENMRGEWAPPLPPEDRLTVILAQIGLHRTVERHAELRKKGAALRAKVLNRWKAGYASRIASLAGTAERVAGEAAAGAQRAGDSIHALDTERGEQESRLDSLGRHSARLSWNASRLGELRGKVRAAALRALHLADAELSASVARKERNLHCLAGRAAAGGGHALRGESIRHYEAAMASPAGPGGASTGRMFGVDEVLYALAELRYEEAQSRFREKGPRPGETPDYGAPLSLYRRLIEEFPDSPYTESAIYSLAHCHQEMGNASEAAAAMETLLARYPGSRYTDDIVLRLGEQYFEENDLKRAEQYYRKVRDSAAPDRKAVALFKLGWSLYLQGRPKEAVDPFLGALVLSPPAAKTERLSREALRMTARSLVDGEQTTETVLLLAGRGAPGHGPSLLLEIQEILDAAGRHGEAIGVADKLGAAYPLSAERVAAEVAAASALRKAGREEESHSRRAGFHVLLGPGSRWQGAAGRTKDEIERGNRASEEGLRDAVLYFHSRARESGTGDRGTILALYSAYADLFPDSPKACDMAAGKAWLLHEMGRKTEAGREFEAAACNPDRSREEVARYMAIQCAKDISSPSDPGAMAEVVRLCRDYERSFPQGIRVGSVLLDRARAHFHLRDYSAAAEAARLAETALKERNDLRAAFRLAGEAWFQAGEFAGAEAAFRSALAVTPEPEERNDVENWIVFSRFRLAESLPPEKAGEAAALFLAVSGEFPLLETAPVARFRAGASYAEAGRTLEAVEAFLPLESERSSTPLATDASRWLARLFEKDGRPIPAAERYARLAAVEAVPSEKWKLLLRAADLFETGGDRPRARGSFSAVASLPGTPAGVKVFSLFRAAENARLAGKAAEADRLYGDAVAAHRDEPAGSAEIVGKALIHRAEFRFREYASLPIAPPLEKSFPRKQSSLEACASLFLEAAQVDDPDTVAASLHRLGELFEDFRSAILASPVPKGLSSREREEYVFLLEEHAAPLEDKAVEAYLRNLHVAVAADFPSVWVDRSIARLKALRPARPDIRDIRRDAP